jgi:4-amino-4-deoxy-L-arabinose transferase-like glycosyltransferase
MVYPYGKSNENYNIVGIGISVLCMVSFMILARDGIGIGPDGTDYIDGARNILRGYGFKSTIANPEGSYISHYAPMLSILLASIGICGLDPIDGVIVVNGLLLAGNVFMAYIIVRENTNRSLYYSLLVAVLVATSVVVLSIHLEVLTEPLFIFLSFLGFYLLIAHIRQANYFKLSLSGVMLGLACITRYAGIPVIPTGILAISFLSTKKNLQKVFDISIFSFIGSLPFVLWIIRNIYTAGSATGREMVFHPPTVSHLNSAIDNLSRWIFPVSMVGQNVKVLFALVVVAFPFIVILFLCYVGKKEGKYFGIKEIVPPIVYVLLGFGFLYSSFLLVSISLFDFATSLGPPRFLSPLHMSWLIIIVILTYRLSYILQDKRTSQICLLLIMVIFSASYVVRGISLISRFCSSDSDLGYASMKWKHSELIKKIESTPFSIMFTNGPDAVHFLAGTNAIGLPERINPMSLEINDEYSAELAKMSQRLSEEQGIVVYFRYIDWRWYLPSEEELLKELPLQLLVEVSDGAIYQLRSLERN